jgi:hypothetical protein
MWFAPGFAKVKVFHESNTLSTNIANLGYECWPLFVVVDTLVAAISPREIVTIA